MTEAELKNEIKNGLSGVYLLAGEEEYLKRYYLTKIRQAILSDEALESFNHTVINYLDGGFGNLSEAVGQTAFMQDKRLTELSGVNFNNAKDSLLKELFQIVSEADKNDEGVFVIYAECDMLDTAKNSKAAAKLNAALGKAVKTVVFDKTTPAKLANWIKRHFEHEGLSVSEADCNFMVERCGRSMQMLSSEIEKVCAYKHAMKEDSVRREDMIYICSKNEEIGAFALANSVLSGNTAEMFKVLGEYKKTDTDVKPKAVLASVCSVYGTLCMVKELSEAGLDDSAIAKKLKIHEYKAKLYARTAKAIPAQKLERAMMLCVDADSEMKFSFSDFIALERLLCTISSDCRR
ncbi:MAG: DNA polymerase III subunit delta [Clostridia bacterium]|nr:DNA polymerase III subunit delta [Clostridia bacterium]